MNVTRTNTDRSSMLTEYAVQYIEEYENIYIETLKNLGVFYENPYQ